MKKIGIVTGLRSEARCLNATPLAENADIRVAAAISAQARKGAQELVAAGCSVLVSFGIAGGLDPRLKTGALVLANEIIAPDGRRFQTDECARQRLHNSLDRDIPVTHAPILGSNKLILSSRVKINLHVDTGAAAVDMESHEVAQVAAEAGLPFLAVRAISDSALDRLPRSIIGALTADGDPRPVRVFFNLLRRPFELPELIRLRRGSAIAHKSLSRVAAAGGPLLGFG